MPSRHFIIKGKVQGVFFRASAKEIADELGISGWVRNTLDGNVEAMASGTEDQINAFTDWCRMGPPRSSVQEVVATDATYVGQPGFIILR